jgi:hypothetical protein
MCVRTSDFVGAPPFFAMLRYSSRILVGYDARRSPQRAKRIGAENSTCARFGKKFLFPPHAEMPFFVGFARRVRAPECAAGAPGSAPATLDRAARCCDFRCEVRAKRVF